MGTCPLTDKTCIREQATREECVYIQRKDGFFCCRRSKERMDGLVAEARGGRRGGREGREGGALDEGPLMSPVELV